MIKINLLPVRAAKKKETMRQQISVAALSLVFLLIIIGYVHVSTGKKIADVKDRTAAAKDELAKTKALIGEVSKVKEAKQALEDKLGVIDSLKKNREASVKILDELGSVVPERLWVSTLKAKENAVNIEGVAISNEVIAKFMTDLEMTEHYKDIELVVTEQTEQEGIKLKKFSLAGKLEGVEVKEAKKEAKKDAKKKEAPKAAKK